MNRDEKETHFMKYRAYVLVWLTLVILTAITYGVATSEGLRLGGWAVPVALAIAGTKSGLVLTYFMHLRSERLTIFRIMIPLVMAVLFVFIALTFSDVAFRHGVK